MTTVYVTIGNADDRLSQSDWAAYVRAVSNKVAASGGTLCGSWISYPADTCQSACWGVELHPDDVPLLRGHLAGLAWNYRQDSISWHEVSVAQLIPDPTLEPAR